MIAPFRCLAVTAVLTLPTSVTAAEDALPVAPAPRQGFELNLGVGPLLYPAFPGARTYRVLPFPYLSGGCGERVEFELLDALRVSAVQVGGFSAGPAARLRFGRHLSEDRVRLVGLRQFDDTVEAGGFFAYEAGPLYADATATQDVGRAHGGAALELRALLQAPLGPVGVIIGPEARLVSRTFAQAYYGTSVDSASVAGRPAYAAHGGLERAGLLAAAEWPLAGRWSLRGFAEYGRLLGSASGSPLVRGPGGALDQFYAGLFLVWRAF